jgi:hypothetical protein
VIDPGSLVGFGLALVATAWVSSALLCAAVLLGRRSLARLGPAVERAAAAGALTLAPIAGGVVVTAVAVYSLSPAWFSAVDHCSQHGHHPHLCLLHGGAWADAAWAVVLLSMAVAGLGIGVVRRMVGSWRTSFALGRLRRVSQPGPEGVLIAPADRAFCFAAGLRRRNIFVSTAAWAALDADERRAVLAHERSHIAQADVGRHVALYLASLLGVPWLAWRVLTLWRSATERVCDQHAAREVSPTAVASALVTMSRLRPGPTVGFSFGRSSTIVERVEALLGEGPLGGELARRVAWSGWVLLAMTGLAALFFAEPVHHFLETLLGML